MIVGTVNGTSTAVPADKFTYGTLPTVTLVSPNSGPTGTGVTLTGTSFTGATGVTVGGVTAGFTAGTDTSMAVTIPAGTPGGLVHILVTNGLGTSSAVSADQFTNTGLPTVTSLSINTGPTTGGTTVVITGTNFTPTATVAFGGTPASVVYNSGTSLTATSPGHIPGNADVAVSTAYGTSINTAADNFTYTSGSLPVITSLSPNFGPIGGGNVITITGTNLTGTGTTTVSFGTSAATPYSSSSTSLLVVVPVSSTFAAQTVQVLVTTSAGTSVADPGPANDYTYGTSTLPVITSLNPASGPISGGNAITITGSNFSGATVVSFGSSNVAPFSVTPTSLVVFVPASSTFAAQMVQVTVTTLAGTSVADPGTANDYTYTGGPTVTFVSPDSGPASGTTFVTITGTGFTSSGMTVTFGGTAAVFSYLSPTSISAVSPAHVAGTFDVIVTTAAGSSPNTTLDDFTYTGTSAPVITSISPTTGPIGTTVTITGTGFTGATLVTVGGVSASFSVVTDSSITLTIPTGTPGGVVNISVTTPNGTSVDVAADNFTNTSSSGATTTYTLYFRWSLISWSGIDNITAYNAVHGIETGTANPATNDVSASVTAIWYFDGPTQTFKGYFVGFDNTPGANDFTTLRRGTSYWIAISTSPSVTWTVLQGS